MTCPDGIVPAKDATYLCDELHTDGTVEHVSIEFTDETTFEYWFEN